MGGASARRRRGRPRPRPAPDARAGIQGAKRRAKPWRTTKPDLKATRRPDLVERNFKVEAPDRLWVADLTYLRCWEGLVFFAFVLDAFSRKVVGWQLAAHIASHLSAEAGLGRLPSGVMRGSPSSRSRQDS